MIAAIAEKHASCAQQTARIEGGLRRIEERIAALTTARTRLRHALRRCRRGECDIVDKVESAVRRAL